MLSNQLKISFYDNVSSAIKHLYPAPEQMDDWSASDFLNLAKITNASGFQVKT